MDHSPDQVEMLRDELATLRQEVETLRAAAATTRLPAAGVETVEPPHSNRRGFLRLAGAAAVGATAVAVAGSTQQAAAAGGSPMLIGRTNVADTVFETTRLISTSGTTLDFKTFQVDNSSTTFLDIPSGARVAGAFTVAGTDTSDGHRVAVYARVAGSVANPGGIGVLASADGDDSPFPGYLGLSSIGLVATAKAGGLGVVGSTAAGDASSFGVLGLSPDGFGVVALSDTGVSLVAGGAGRFQQSLTGALGAPAAGSHAAGEQVRDSAGDMYICTTAGTPGTWRKMTAQAPGFANSGGSINLLATPIRLLDTRPGTSAPINNGFVRVAGNTTLALQITGTTVATPFGSLSVPAGSKGVIGNLTIIGPSGDGYAQVWPSGAPPTTSTINYGPVNANPAIANSFTCGLTAAGKLNILTFATAHVLFDVAGFVF